MTCHEARALFSDLADRRLGATTRAACEAHLATCAECRREWEGFERTLDLLHELPRHRAPAGFADRVLAAARPRPWPQRLARRLFVPWHVKLPLEAPAIAPAAVGAAGFADRVAAAARRRLWPQRLARRLFVPMHVKLPLEAAAIALVAVGAALMVRTPEMQQAMHETSSPSYQPPAPAVEGPGGLKAETASEPKGVAPAGSKAQAPAERKDVAKSFEAAGRREKRLADESPPEPAARAPEPATPGAVDKPSELAAPGASAKASERPAPGALSRSSDAARVRSTAAPVSGRLAAAVPVLTGRLAVDERAEADRALAALIGRIGATEMSRAETPDGVVVEIDIPRAQYADLVSGLAGIGAWTPEGAPKTDADRLRVSVHLVPRPAR